MLVTKVFCKFVYVIFLIESHECRRNVRNAYVTLAECMAEVARVEVYDLLDDALTVSILELRSRLEKIKPGVRQDYISHNIRKI